MAEILLSKTTRIYDIITEFPFMKDELIKLNPKLKRLQNPILRKTVGRKATLTDVAQLINSDYEEVVKFIVERVEKYSSTKLMISSEAEEMCRARFSTEGIKYSGKLVEVTERIPIISPCRLNGVRTPNFSL